MARSERGTPAVTLTAAGQTGLPRLPGGPGPRPVAAAAGAGSRGSHVRVRPHPQAVRRPAGPCPGSRPRSPSPTPAGGSWTRRRPPRSRRAWRCWSTRTWTPPRCSSTGKAQARRPSRSSSCRRRLRPAVGLALRTGIADRPGGGTVGGRVGVRREARRPAPPAAGRDRRPPRRQALTQGKGKALSRTSALRCHRAPEPLGPRRSPCGGYDALCGGASTASIRSALLAIIQGPCPPPSRRPSQSAFIPERAATVSMLTPRSIRWLHVCPNQFRVHAALARGPRPPARVGGLVGDLEQGVC